MKREFDLVVIGGGITGAGLFQRAASLGLRVILLEKGSAGAQTTGASSGLVHGGLRYLPYDVGTSVLCCRECGALRRLYPDLLRRQVFLWPVYRADRYGIELVESLLEYYDHFAKAREGRLHVRLAPSEAVELEPALQSDGLTGAVGFDEWTVDAVALVRRLLEEGQRRGGELLEGARATRFEIRGGMVERVRFSAPGGEESGVSGGMVVNATGPWAEQTARLAGCGMVHLTLRKGVHLVLDDSPARRGLIFQDLTGRAIGLYPRGRRAWIGPTDDPFDGLADDAVDAQQERSMLWESLRRLFPGLAPGRLRTVAGLRPILRQRGPWPLSRDYRVYDHAEEGLANLVTVTGGKLTVYRPMVEEVLRLVLPKLGRDVAPARDEYPPSGPLMAALARRGRPASLLASAALLAYFAARHVPIRIAGPGRSGLDLFRRTYGDEEGP